VQPVQHIVGATPEAAAFLGKPFEADELDAALAAVTARTSSAAR